MSYQAPDDPHNAENIARGAKAVNDCVSGWFKYDHWPLGFQSVGSDSIDYMNGASQTNGMANVDELEDATLIKASLSSNPSLASGIGSPKWFSFIHSTEHPIRPSLIETALDREELLKASYPPAYPSENIITQGVLNGAFRDVALRAMEWRNRGIRSDGSVVKIINGVSEGVKAKVDGVNGHHLPSSSSTPSTDIEQPNRTESKPNLLEDVALNWLWCENGPWPTAICPHFVHNYKPFGFGAADVDAGSKRKMVVVRGSNHFVSPSVRNGNEKELMVLFGW